MCKISNYTCKPTECELKQSCRPVVPSRALLPWRHVHFRIINSVTQSLPFNWHGVPTRLPNSKLWLQSFSFFWSCCFMNASKGKIWSASSPCQSLWPHHKYTHTMFKLVGKTSEFVRLLLTFLSLLPCYLCHALVCRVTVGLIGAQSVFKFLLCYWITCDLLVFLFPTWHSL